MENLISLYLSDNDSRAIPDGMIYFDSFNNIKTEDMDIIDMGTIV